MNTQKRLDSFLRGMSIGNSQKALECRCTRCKYNNNGNCGYQGRVLINANGECEIMEEGFGGGGPGPYG
jgi:hypothetical protein